jgi:hypothetical protein
MTLTMKPTLHLTALTVAILLASMAATPALAVDDAAVLRCRALTDAGPRLACYDALPVAGARAAASPAVAPPAATVAAGAAVAPAAAAQRDFGLPPAATPGGEVNAVDSSIVGRFEGWGPDQQIALANGQVWRVVDGSRAAFTLNNPKARVERGAFSAFFLVIEGTNHSPRVRRVR